MQFSCVNTVTYFLERLFTSVSWCALCRRCTRWNRRISVQWPIGRLSEVELGTR